MPREPDPPSRAFPSQAPSIKPSEQAFIRAVSERPPPPEPSPPDAPSSSGSVDTTVDEVLIPRAAPLPAPGGESPEASDDRSQPTTEDEASLDDAKPLVEGDDLVGATLSKTYEIRRVVGEGGMGRVYEARHTRIASKRFAVKTLHPEYLRQPDVLARFQREAEAAATIDSPHVVGVVDVDRTRDGRPFLVTDFLEGEDLGARIKKRGALSEAAAVHVVRQVCLALSAAHAAGIVHRDIKPDNVFLTGSPTAPLAKVLDFGISRVTSEAGNSLTKTGMIMGTPAYMAPEQARGSRVDHRADIYALGAVLYSALTGKEPFELDDPSAVLAAVLTRDPPRPRSLVPTLDENLELIVQRAMAKEPDHRFADAAELYATLAPYDTLEPEEPGSTPRAASVAWPQRSHVRPRSPRTHLGSKPLGVRLARSSLVVAAIGSLAWVLALGAQAVGAGVRLARDGRGLSGTETLIVVLVGALTLATPAVMSIRYVRHNVWHNTAKVLGVVEALRSPLIASILTYGLFALVIRSVEVTLLDQASRVAWPVWSLMLVVFSLTAGIGSALVTRAASRPAASDGEKPARIPRDLLPTVAAGAGLLVALSAISAAVTQRDQPASEPMVADSDASAAAPTAEPTARERKSKHATTVEIETAKQEGVAGLTKLREAYPTDAAVVQALMLAQGATTEGLPAAVDLAEELFRMRPAAAGDEAVIRFIYRAANSSEAVSNKAFSLMKKSMGAQGPDLLYELWIADGAQSGRAEKALGDPAVRSRGTAALRIAVDLRKAEGCKAKGALLDRAAQDGDERVVVILKPLSTGTRRGCGFLDLSPCPARCSAQAAKMKQVISAVRAKAK
ncbi:MAG: serine/threonine protein kinase [Deltaproteobacteria bacterium]|jgi:serine/threonine-protein kinase|nr:serine/threonine protein kinase [Deltaproteobacteria bacterium]MBW2533101.1 serine/threonine protein kinase [Deltaproteobacteria bacterium]